MIELEHISQRTNLGYKGTVLDKVYNHRLDEVYTLEDGHYLIVDRNRDFIVYSVINQKCKVTLVLTTIDKKKYESVYIVEGSKKNQYPAIKLYSFLIKKLNKTLVTKEQSYGGMRLWQKLSRVRGVSVHGWDFDKNKVVNTDRYLKDVDDLYVNPSIKRYHKDIANIQLVASAL